MQIAIAGDCQMYIYLKDTSKHQHLGNLSDVKCNLLYDLNDNFIGMKILSQRSDTGMDIMLPSIGEIEFPIHNATVSQNEDGIFILFDQDVVVHKEVEDECIIDFCAAGITGIEPMPFTNIGGKEIIKPFIIRDIQDVYLPRQQ